MILEATAYVLLEDGTRFDGLACGADGQAVGEIVFTTSMSGYQEAMTDPSYAGQLITFTFPMIGNYGVSADAMESDRVHARAAIMRVGRDREDAPGAERGWLGWLADCGVPAITPLRVRVASSTARASPKSVSVTRSIPRSSRMFAGLTSRCTNP